VLEIPYIMFIKICKNTRKTLEIFVSYLSKIVDRF
jgi:hypothetical protein